MEKIGKRSKKKLNPELGPKYVLTHRNTSSKSPKSSRIEGRLRVKKFQKLHRLKSNLNNTLH
jgi:hypothetical protein